jgi:hypothetical protein
MGILDQNNLLPEESREAYRSLLKRYGHKPHQFELEIREDQSSTDMNDIQYVIIIKARATHVNTNKSKTYMSRAGSRTWLAEFEEDLENAYFVD